MNNEPSLSYLAAPYRHEDPKVLSFRLAAVTYTAYEMIRKGRMVFSPLTHNMPIDRIGFHGDWSVWKTYDRLMLERCDALTVLTLPGWEESKGVRAEIRWAEELNMPIEMVALTREAEEIAIKESVKGNENLKDALIRTLKEHPSQLHQTTQEIMRELAHTLSLLGNQMEDLSEDRAKKEFKEVAGGLLISLFHVAETLQFDLIEEGRLALLEKKQERLLF